jgi:hypothetical protein
VSSDLQQPCGLIVKLRRSKRIRAKEREVEHVGEAAEHERRRSDADQGMGGREVVEHVPTVITRTTVLDPSATTALRPARWLYAAVACGAAGSLLVGRVRALLKPAFRRRRR